MVQSKDAKKSLDEPLAAFIDGDIEADEAARLAEALRAQPSLAQETANLLAMDQWLRSECQSDDAFVAALETRFNAEDEGEDFVRAVEKRTSVAGPRRTTTSFLPWAIAAVATVLAAWSWRPGPNGSDARRLNVSHDAPPFVALLVSEHDARFDGRSKESAFSFAAGSYALLEGAAHLRFRNGADLILQAPSAFEIHDAFNVALTHGEVRAIVPPSAKGFTVAVPDAMFEDLGTEFGAAVDGDSGASELHVFDGLVEVKTPNKSALLASVTHGQAVAVTNGTVSEIPAAAPSRFTTASTIAYQRWLSQRETFQQDPDLVFYFPFIEGEHLINEATFGAEVIGTIKGADWVTGRWPGKRALQFEALGDSVELNIPGRYASYSMAAWVKVNQLEHSLNAFLNSDGWGPGMLHWQLNRLGYCAAGHFEGTSRSITDVRATLGQWTHVALVVDGSTQKGNYYFNGHLAMTEALPPGTVFRPGVSHLGKWHHPIERWQPEVRDFRGRVDELAMWRRALTEEEIVRLAREGRPGGHLLESE